MIQKSDNLLCSVSSLMELEIFQICKGDTKRQIVGVRGRLSFEFLKVSKIIAKVRSMLCCCKQNHVYNSKTVEGMQRKGQTWP